MNPNFDAPPSLHLPEPAPAVNSSSYEQAPSWQPPEYGAPAAPETGTPPPAPSFAVPPPTDPATAPAAATQPLAQTPAVAADDDLIEKEWVIKAKQIVSTTREDPYQQNRQLAAFKADYMQKRYNKTIKLSE